MRLHFKRLFTFFLVVGLAGFISGYLYAAITSSMQNKSGLLKTSAPVKSKKNIKDSNVYSDIKSSYRPDEEQSE